MTDVEHLEFLVEEPSAEAGLSLILPRVLGDVTFAIHPYQGKRDLLAKLPMRLRAYVRWIPASVRIVVLVDRDNDDCYNLKANLEQIAMNAGLSTASSRASSTSDYQVLNRIAIEELEAWYFGDWEAVRVAYPRVSASTTRRARYRDPDGIPGGTWEAFERVLKQAGYFKGGLGKITAAREIAPNMDPAHNRSASFQVLYQALLRLN